jgi:hypothetical protein
VDDEEALRLNNLHRFRKHSPRLLLEEYSHCEVPAGCGGAVLRWVDPRVGTPAIVRTFAEAEIALWLDGAPLESGRVDLSAGTHVLALALDKIVPPKRSRPAPLLLSIVRGLGQDREDAEHAIVLLASSISSGWRITGEPPPGNWFTPEFDDSTWSVPEGRELDVEQRESWRARQLEGHGAIALALPATHAWVRVRFQVPERHIPEGE